MSASCCGLDEFEITFKHRDQFPEDFFDHMRSLLNIRTLAMVTASRKTLEAHSLEGNVSSPFYINFNADGDDAHNLARADV